jgi:hypothetical protein
MEWISVTAQLPKTRKDVLTVIQEPGYNYREMQVGCYTKGGEIPFDDYDDNFPECYNEDHDCSYLPEGWWFLEDDNEKSVKKTVTHWMPLPEFPPRP